ncbi:hypothetical protein R6Q59_006158 [Mikania micrantha]
MAGYTTFFKALKFGCLYVNFLVVQIQYFWWVKGGWCVDCNGVKPMVYWNMMCVRGEVWIDRTIGMRGLLLGLDGIAKVLGGLLLARATCGCLSGCRKIRNLDNTDNNNILKMNVSKGSPQTSTAMKKRRNKEEKQHQCLKHRTCSC